MNILVTGANGFVGRSLVSVLKQQHNVFCALRPGKENFLTKDNSVKIIPFTLENLCQSNALDSLLKETQVVVHLAGLAHVPVKGQASLELHCMNVNYEGTLNLARHAAAKGVKRFVFVSSANVHGKSDNEKYLRKINSPLLPYDPYTKSKILAEQALIKLQKITGMEMVILRPPLVYGPGVKANFLKLLWLVHANMPLPFAGINNLRSYISLDNLVNALALCVTHTNAANRIFLLSDGPALSTTQLVQDIATAMGKQSPMFHVPYPLMEKLLICLGQSGIYDRLWLNSMVDSSEICRTLKWQPVISWKQSIQDTVKWYTSFRTAKKTDRKK